MPCSLNIGVVVLHQSSMACLFQGALTATAPLVLPLKLMLLDKCADRYMHNLLNQLVLFTSRHDAEDRQVLEESTGAASTTGATQDVQALRLLAAMEAALIKTRRPGDTDPADSRVPRHLHACRRNTNTYIKNI